MAEVGPTSLDGKKSQPAKLEKLREEAQYEKERGNAFVKQEKWDEAVRCYNRAIELVKDDAIYYANRGLCYLKKDSLHQAESDCTEALRLDPTYVKALQRRATARERLGSLRSASHDLNEVLKLEPHNAAARKQLEAIKARMGTKGSKSKSSPSSTPLLENKHLLLPSKPTTQVLIEEITEPAKKVDEPVKKAPTPEENWRNGVGENVTVIKTVKKPPHLRSKRALKAIPIQEIPLGKTSPENPPNRISIMEIEDDKSHGDSDNHDSNKILEKMQEDIFNVNGGEKLSPESEKLLCENVTEKVSVANMVPPVNSVQFMSEWKYLKGRLEARSDYLSIIDPAKIPSIFENALESEVLSEVLQILAEHTDKFEGKVAAYLRGLASVKRFSALAMFLNSNDKQCKYAY
ncbi:RNA polymerase II-associated protein 3-like isoform X2 [Hyposmocoma kahamanoa]|nr:RNA polymerase II-associated protein 3-like isoform X2 [Hyposmocoma kahamanoa]